MSANSNSCPVLLSVPWISINNSSIAELSKIYCTDPFQMFQVHIHRLSSNGYSTGHRMYFSLIQIESCLIMCHKYNEPRWNSTKKDMISQGYDIASFTPLFHGGYFENFESWNTASIWSQIWEGRPKLCPKIVFMVMTSSMTSQGGLKVSFHIHV